jgi:NNP family nitrate/nitrite transporter-like MFS transporter
VAIITPPEPAVSESTSTARSSGPNLNLTLATLGFGITFWGWALLGPLGPRLQEQLGLSAQQLSLLVAVPVIVGSLGRIPVGALTDRYGARVMLPAVALVSVLPVLYLGFFASSFTAYIVGGFFLGIAGTSFAVGVPLVNGWFPPARRGLAIGIFGVGMGGTAISAFTTVKLTTAYGAAAPFVLVAVLLVVYGVLGALLIQNAPNRPAPATGSMLTRFWSTVKLGVTLRASAMYALGFGGFVAFSVYLPTYLKNAYGLTQQGAAMRTAGFVVLAVVMRPVGGWLSDKVDPLPVLTVAFGLTAILAAITATHPQAEVVRGAVFLALAGSLGAAAGATFAYVARFADPQQVGSVTGVVGACGGLGGFVPPLVMGSIFARTGGYGPGLLALAVVAIVAAAWTLALHRRSRVTEKVTAKA